MKDYIIVVGDSNKKNRLLLVQLLYNKGYKVYEASDGAGVLRLARTMKPTLVLLDTNIWGMNAFDVANIVENNNLSTIVFITDKRDKFFYEKLKEYKLFAYLSKPINPYQVDHLIEFAIMNSNKMDSLYEKVEKLENTLSARKKIEKAKGLLIQKMKLTEAEAFKLLRKRSMDMSLSMEKVAMDIIKKYVNL